MARLDIKEGDKFGRLTVIKEVERHVYPSGDYRRKFLCSCECGSEPKSYLLSSLRRGTTQSCGCLNLERVTSHGMHDTRVYQIWADMKDRCDNPKNKYYYLYGERGIGYDLRWSNFEEFWNDMKEGYDDSLTLDKIDNNSDYSKDNCRWEVKSQQSHNRRKIKGTGSKYIGVLKIDYGTRIRYLSRIKQEGKAVYLGSFVNEYDAAVAYDNASERIYGDRPNRT